MRDDDGIFDVLKTEHREVLDRLDALRAVSDTGQREKLFAALTREIERHAMAEEEILYPRLDESPKAAKDANSAQDEHNEVRDRIDIVDAMSAGDSDWTEGVARLRAAFAAHVKHEETEIFNVMREAFTPEQLEQIRRDFVEARSSFGADAA